MKKEHGTIKSYITGFALSLVFTFIPYYLVVTQAVRGDVLLGTIIGFALVQMIIQVVFFLHLGRERKPYWQTGFLVATIGAIFVVVVGSSWIMHHLHANMTPTESEMKAIEGEGIAQIGGTNTGACEGAFVLHKVTISGGVAIPSHIDAHRCDRIAFTNEDGLTRNIAFGSRQSPEQYGGVESLTLDKGQPETLILNVVGTHLFRDGVHEVTTGDFTVTP